MRNDQIHYLVESQRFEFPERKLNPKTIRQSVIVNLFKQGWDLKDVQLFAGYRHISSTEAYLVLNVVKHKNVLGDFQPLKVS